MVADCMALVARGKPEDIAAAIRQGLRVYSVGLGALIILTETEWDRFLSLFRALDGWIIRGFLQLFEAGLTLELARAMGASDFHRSTQLYRIVAGASLSGCGIFYVLGGVLCVGRLKRARYKRTAELVKVQQELDSVDRRRGELRSLLAVYSDE
ncbi:hypothetical protein WJX74_005076 [Apatococcus lobatus]|uniref:Transmembrane protein n=1 Tax=Apatococcus lobatus TaxID=904363 RepID=A0AAW1RF50_9CHLO